MNGQEEKRKYIRLDSVFPIEFQLVDKDDRRPLSELYEGFTRNIGKGGIGIFTKTLKAKDSEFFNFIPHETKLKVIVNIPLDKEPIESFATVEWVEKQSGPIIDTYLFGISFNFINELEYERIVSYAKWLRLKPKLIFSALVLLTVAFAASLALLFHTYKSRVANERKLVTSVAKTEQARKAKVQAEQERSAMETELESAKRKKMAMQAVLERVAKKKKMLEEMTISSEEDKKDLELQLGELAEEKALLEERIEKEAQEAEEKNMIESETAAIEEGFIEISEDRLRAEEANYNKFREFILNEKIQSLSAYVSTHRSSIYHAAALFALAELRYKYGEKALATVSYNEVIELYPRSKYALYSSHRLEQLSRNYSYTQYVLKDFYDTYNLPELFDYRSIEPYVK